MFYRNTQKQILDSIPKKKAELLDTFQEELFPLLEDLQNLHCVKILRGNYNLKIARQDYFLGKQSEVSFFYIEFRSNSDFILIIKKRKVSKK